MTRDEILRMAREAGWPGIYVKPMFSIAMQEDDFLRFAALVADAAHKRRTFELAESYRCGWDGGVKAEREACEKACLNVEIFGHTFNADAAPMELAFQIAEATALDCAAAIRARGKK